MSRFSIVLFLFVYFQESPNPYLVVGVIDGDTITILGDDDKSERIRLASIDAPEKGQDFGQRSKQYLDSLIFKKYVFVQRTDTDQYGRTIAFISFSKTDFKNSINHQMVRAGLAWHYKRYSKDLSLDELEKEARHARRGLWVQPNAIAPWEFRRAKRN